MPKFHKDSIFGPGYRVPLDREARAQFRAKLQLQRRPGRLTIAARAVGLVLVDMLGPDGRLDPTISTIATLACVDAATVKRALGQLKLYGFLTWVRRLVRGAGTGWRCEQTSNAYLLRVPACGAHFAPRVPSALSKKTADRSEGWESQVAEASRQLLLLGFSTPVAWNAPTLS